MFVARHPAPDPDANLRSRPLEPTGGSVRFLTVGQKREATWDGDGGWRGADGGGSAGDVVSVHEAGLVDG